MEHAVRSYKDARIVQANIIVCRASIIVTIFLLISITFISDDAISALDFIQAVQHARTLTNAYLA